MAGASELDSFVRKFVNLWKAGSHAKLHVETLDGDAFVNLQVGLGHALPEHGGHHGGGPSKQRRRIRRAAARKAKSTAEVAEEAAATASDVNGKVTAEEAVKADEKVAAEDSLDESGNLSCKYPASPIPQLDGTGDVKAKYELKIEAPEVVTHEDIVEAIDANFLGTLDDVNVEKNNFLRHFNVKKVTDDQSLLKIYTMVVNDDPIVTDIVEGWKERYKFDELAFKNYDYENIKIRVKEVKRLS